MGNDKTRDIHYVSESNKNAIVNLLRMNGPASRADISRGLGLSFPAVSSNVKGLLESGLICEAGDAGNAMGRKGKLLMLNTNKLYFIGLDVGSRSLCAMCADVVGRVLSYKRRSYTDTVLPDQIGAFLHELIGEAGVELADVVAIGVGIPNAYEREDEDPGEGCGSAVLSAYLRQNFSQKIYMEGSAGLGAVGERWKGGAQGLDDVVFLDFDVELTAGILQNGRLIRGKNRAAGSVGFMTLERGFLSSSGKKEGALEQLIPGRQINRLLSKGEEEDIDLELVEQQLRSYLSPIFTDYMHVYLAMAIINLIVLLDPEIVVISGRLGRAIYEKYQVPIQALIRSHVPFCPTICCSALKEKANVYGAVALAAEESNDKYREFFE